MPDLYRTLIGLRKPENRAQRRCLSAVVTKILLSTPFFIQLNLTHDIAIKQIKIICIILPLHYYVCRVFTLDHSNELSNILKLGFDFIFFLKYRLVEKKTLPLLYIKMGIRYTVKHKSN